MSRATLLGLFYCSIFIGTGASLPYMPVWFRAHGLSGLQIGVILSAPMLGLQTGNRPKRAARALAWIMSRTKPTDYILGDSGDAEHDVSATDALGTAVAYEPVMRFC